MGCSLIPIRTRKGITTSGVCTTSGTPLCSLTARQKPEIVIADTIGQKCAKEVDVTVANGSDGGAPDAATDADGGAPDGGDGRTDAGGSVPDAATDPPVDAPRDAIGDPDVSSPESSDGAITADAARPDSGGTGGNAGNDGGRDADAAGGQPPRGSAGGLGLRMQNRRRPQWVAGLVPSFVLAFAVSALRARRRRRCSFHLEAS